MEGKTRESWILELDDIEYNFTEQDFAKVRKKIQQKKHLDSEEILILSRVESVKSKALLQKQFQQQIDALKIEISKKDELIEKLNIQIKKQTDEINQERTKRIIYEKREVKKSVILSGLPMSLQDGERVEREETTIELVKTFLKALKLKVTSLSHAERFKPRENPNGSAEEQCVPNIKLQFTTINGKLELFKHLKNLSKTSFKGIKCSIEYPFSLRNELKILNKKSYELRREGKITRIFIQGTTLVLKQKKSKQDKKWEDC